MAEDVQMVDGGGVTWVGGEESKRGVAHPSNHLPNVAIHTRSWKVLGLFREKELPKVGSNLPL